MSATPTISVLMSVYNGERYLAAAMDGILAQTFTDFELIVIDDGSKDSSPAILQDYAKRDPRVKLTLRENKGLTVTLNEAFAQSTGKYLARMDCDDVALPHRFAKQVELLDSNPDVVCTGGYFQLIDGAGRLLTTLTPPTNDSEIQATLLKGHNAICHPCAMIRRTAMERVGGYDMRFKTSQDLDLWLRLGEVGKLANVAVPVLKFRLHESSVSETKREQQRQMGRLACEEAWKRRGLTNMTYEAGEPWRPGADRASRHEFAVLYGWWAFKSGQRRTAMIYGAKAIAAMPMKPDGWKLVACAMVKPVPRPPPQREPSTMNTAISVIMPVYNTERFVAGTTESVLAQTFRDFELIAIDDGSTDRSHEILESFAKRDPRVRVVSRPNKGLVATLNEGLALAKAPLVARMDADDLCDPRRFELQVKALNDNPPLVAVGCCAAAIDEDGNRLGDYSTPLSHEEIEASHLRGDSAIHHPSVMFRTDIVRNLGGYRDLVPCEDFDLWLRLGEIGRLANLPEPLITKRLFPGSIVATTLDKRQRVLKQIMSEAWQRRNLPGSPPVPKQPVSDRGDLFRQWGWMALKEGHVRTSRRYAFKAMKAQPFRGASWRLMACSLRGR